MKIPSSNLGRTCCVQKLFLTFRTILVHNMFSPCSAKEKSFWQTFLTFIKYVMSKWIRYYFHVLWLSQNISTLAAVQIFAQSNLIYFHTTHYKQAPIIQNVDVTIGCHLPKKFTKAHLYDLWGYKLFFQPMPSNYYIVLCFLYT